MVHELPLRDRHALEAEGRKTDGYWGFIWREVGYPHGPRFDDMTLSEVAMLEWQALEGIMRRAFGGPAMVQY